MIKNEEVVYPNYFSQKVTNNYNNQSFKNFGPVTRLQSLSSKKYKSSSQEFNLNFKNKIYG